MVRPLHQLAAHAVNVASDMSLATLRKGYLASRVGLVHSRSMAAGDRKSSRILFHMSSVETTDHMSWDMPRRTVEAAEVRDTNTKEGENSPLEQGNRPQ
jgi:hypothetical protein